MAKHPGIWSRRTDSEGYWNLLLVTALAIAVLLFLLRSNAVNLDEFWLAFLFEYVVALWISFSMPTTRVITLALVGAGVGCGTEFTAAHAELWTYANDVGVVAGILIYSLTAIALFGLVYVINRVLAHHKFFRATAWGNSLIVLLLFLSLFAWAYGQENNQYWANIFAHPVVVIYYFFLFLFAVTIAYCLRLSALLAIIAAAVLVSLVGQTAGGIWAGIWRFLPTAPKPVTSPPDYLVYALWPLEYFVEFGFSAFLSDLLIYLFKVRPERNGKDNKDPHLPIPFWDWSHPEGRVAGLTRETGHSLVKMLRRTPETGELIVAMVGPLVVFLSLFPEHHWRPSPGAAIASAAVFGIALFVSSRPYWKRTAALVVGGLVFGGMIWIAAEMKVLGEAPTLHLTALPLSALLLVSIYGLAHLTTQLFARLLPAQKEWEDHGEPKRAVVSVVTILMLIIVALFVWNPAFLFPDPHAEPAGAPALFVFGFGVLLIFTLWWYFFMVPLRRSAIQTVVAALATVVFLLPIDWRDGQLAWQRLLWQSVGLVIAYLFVFTTSAHVANEPLAKAIRRTYWWRRCAGKREVVFHDKPHQQGRHRVLDKDTGVMHTYPPKETGVSVAVATQPEEPGQTLPTIRETVRLALEQLRGHWPKPGTTDQTVEKVKEAVAGKTVFIKPNIVVPTGSPYTTDADLVDEVAKYCLEHGAAKVLIGEIAISNITSRMSLVGTGVYDYWKRRNGVEVHLLDEEMLIRVHLSDDPGNKIHPADPTGAPDPQCPVPAETQNRVVFNQFHMPYLMVDADTFFIDIPKMKTHLQSAVTLGIKNSHGAIAECDRGCKHQQISQKVVDITKVWLPDLTIVDGYDALEGIGPWPGDLVPLRAVIASNDVVAADLVAGQMMWKEPVEGRTPAESAPDFRSPVDFDTKFVKTTWLGYEQRLGLLDPRAVKYDYSTNDPDWNTFLRRHCYERPFRDPDYCDEGLIMNIGQRVGGEVDFATKPLVQEYDPLENKWLKWPANREYLPLRVNTIVPPFPALQQPTRAWGPAQMIADEFRFPDLGSSVMFSGVFGLMKCVLEDHFTRELNVLDGFAIVYGPLRKPLVCEGAILFGDGAISTEYLVFSPRIYPLAGKGKPPNRYSDIFERLSQELGGKILSFATEAITATRGWYW